MTEHDGEIRKLQRLRDVERRQGKRRARTRMHDYGEPVAQRGLKEEIATRRQRIQRLILRLQLQRAKAEFLRAPPHLIVELLPRDERIDAARAIEAVRVTAYGIGNLIVLRAEVVHDRE